MTPNEYQKLAMRTDCYKDIREATMNLAAEVGEVCGKISKVYRDNDGIFDKNKIGPILDECGDVLWQITKVIDYFCSDLESVMVKNISKLEDRFSRGMIKGSGDNR